MRSIFFSKPYLAGAFSQAMVEVKTYNEHYSGPLENMDLLSWPDMVVLSGLNAAFDRMLHITAYTRSLNPSIVVVAGGPAIRVLPHLAKRYFDYVCLGDVEEMESVITDVWGRSYVDPELLEKKMAFPRMDLAYWLGSIGHVESSRNCNFRCGFCSLTAENGKFLKYDIDYFTRQMEYFSKIPRILMVDNNFYGPSREFFHQRLEHLQRFSDSRTRAGQFFGWGALVTADIFKNEDLRKLRKSGCEFLFSGVESFDEEFIKKQNKGQNTLMSPIHMIRQCLEAGIGYLYGYMLDTSSKSIKDMRDEIEFILSVPEIPVPAYFSLPIPLLNTPLFHECVNNQQFLPNVKLRDLDGTTLVLKTHDGLDEVSEFVRELQSMVGYKKKLFMHTVKFIHNYRTHLTLQQLLGCVIPASLLCFSALATSPTTAFKRARRTHIAATENSIHQHFR